MTDRDDHLCSMKCAEVGCLAFYVDKATKMCKLGTINDCSKRSGSGINAHMKIDNKGNPITGMKKIQVMTYIIGKINFAF